MINAASLKVVVGADVNSALAGLGKVQSAVGGFARSIGSLAVAGAAALAGALGLTVKTAADFEQAMANVRSVMAPADAKTYGAELSKLALTLGKDTSFSAMEAAAGIEELIKAGIPLPAILGGAAKSALNLAAAGGIPVADAATIASAALNAFKRPAEDLPKIVDHLAGAANASASDMMQLKFGLSQVAPAAALVGLSMEDTTTALALFSNSGLVGSDAGTSFKNMLLNLQPATKEQTALFKKLGLQTKAGGNAFFDTQGNVKDLAGISDVLGKSLQGLTKQQKLATLEKLFGPDALRAAGILAEQGAGAIRTLQEEISKVSAADVARERLATLTGAMEAMKGSAQTLGITIGAPLLVPLADLAKQATDTLNSLTGTVEGFLEQTATLAADQGISQFSAGISILKGHLDAVGAAIKDSLGPEANKLLIAFGDELAILASRINTLGQDMTGKTLFDFKLVGEGEMQAMEKIAGWMNTIGYWNDRLKGATMAGGAAVVDATRGAVDRSLSPPPGNVSSPSLGPGVAAAAARFTGRVPNITANVTVNAASSDPAAVGDAAESGTLQALVEAQGEVAAMASPDAPGQ